MLKERNVECISILYDKYAPAVYGAINREVNNIEIAEVILEQTFINIWNHPLTELRFANHVMLWLLQTAKVVTAKILAEKELKNLINENNFMQSKAGEHNAPVIFPLQIIT
ncbi:MAG: hypothetical protein ABIN97_05175 [Ginsengibacter sp.]